LERGEVRESFKRKSKGKGQKAKGPKLRPLIKNFVTLWVGTSDDLLPWQEVA
jgi:hypothetical protein